MGSKCVDCLRGSCKVLASAIAMLAGASSSDQATLEMVCQVSLLAHDHLQSCGEKTEEPDLRYGAKALLALLDQLIASHPLMQMRMQSSSTPPADPSSN